MKIVFVSREFPPSKRMGGIATYVKETASYLAEMGHVVYVVCASDDLKSTEEYEENGVKVIRLPGGDFYISGKWQFLSKFYGFWRSLIYYQSYRAKVAECLVGLVKERGVELVEFAEYGNESLVWSKKERMIPWIIRLHGPCWLNVSSGKKVKFSSSPLRWWFGWQEIISLKKATAIFSCSKPLARLVADYMSISVENIQTIPNAICFKKMTASGADPKILANKSNELFRADAAWHIFSAGSVVEGKGYRELVEAVLLLRKQGLSLSLTIAGKLGRLGRLLNEKSRSNSEYKEWLCLMDAVPREALPALYEQADLVVFPSWWESFGLVCIEAMAARGLVIGSAAGGMSDIIQDGKTGFLVTPRSVNLLAQKIKFVLSLPKSSSDHIRSNAMTYAKDQDICHVMMKQLAFYAEVVSKFNGANN